MGLSLAIHLALAAALTASATIPRIDFELDQRAGDYVDVEIAPAAPEIFEPPSDEAVAAVPDKPPESEVIEAQPAQRDDEVAVIIDAGVSDAAPSQIAQNEDAPPDAGVPAISDAAVVAAATSNVKDFDAGIEAVLFDGGAGDGGAVIATGVTPTEDGGAVAVTSTDSADDAGPSDAGTIVAASEGTEASLPSGVNADFASNLPGDDVVSVLLRLDRVRKTPWADQAEAIMKPMPDYQMIIGNRPLKAVELFDALFISSPDPRDVTATSLAAKYRQGPGDLRRLLNHPGAKVDWVSAAGGPMGIRHSRFGPDDDRIYLMPHPQWVALARRGAVGKLAQPTPSLPLVPRGDSAEAPEWIRTMPTLLERSGEDEEGPFVVVTAQGFRGRITVPNLVDADAQLPLPERVSLTVELDPKGFLVRGILFFPNAAEAKKFAADARQIQQDFVGGIFGRKLLSKFGALNIAKGLKLKVNESQVAYVSSMSISDARAMLERVAEGTARYFERRMR